MFQLKPKQQTKQKSTNPSNPFSSVNPNDFIPKRFGLHFQRPTIIMEYLVPSSGKLYHHKMRLEQKLKNNMTVNEILSHLRARHADYLNDVSDMQLTKLINSLKNHQQKSNSMKAPLQNSNQNQQQKQQSQLPSQQSSKLGKLEPLGIKKGFGESKKTSVFDDIDDVDDILDNLGFPDEKPKPTIVQEKKTSFNNNNNFNFSSKQNQNKNNQKDLFKDYQNYDLNKLTTEELQKEKDKMDDVFFVNQKKPGDKEFVYDVQEDFEPYEDNEWDLDEEDDIV